MKLFILGCALIALSLILLGFMVINQSKEMKRWESMNWQERWGSTPKHDIIREMVEER